MWLERSRGVKILCYYDWAELLESLGGGGGKEGCEVIMYN